MYRMFTASYSARDVELPIMVLFGQNLMSFQEELIIDETVASLLGEYQLSCLINAFSKDGTTLQHAIYFVFARLEGPAVSQCCALNLLQASLNESLYEMAGELPLIQRAEPCQLFDAGEELSELVAFVNGTEFELVEYLQRERYGSGHLEDFASELEMIGHK
ncbi:hypothetical protein OROHE_022769 [Orobanche hederae]